MQWEVVGEYYEDTGFCQHYYVVTVPFDKFVHLSIYPIYKSWEVSTPTSHIDVTQLCDARHISPTTPVPFGVIQHIPFNFVTADLKLF